MDITLFSNLLKESRDSEVPGERLSFKKAINCLIGDGNKLITLVDDKEIKKELEYNVKRLQHFIDNYTLYPKLKLNGLNGDNDIYGKTIPLIPV